jgi:DNA invertase Pin-like site-specific DNA recombinase
MRIAYSYMRYSSSEQEDGDSVRRQTNARNSWLKRHPDVKLDTTRTYLDRGRSAFHGRHLQKGGALAGFRAEVERGDIVKDSILLIENLDRLSRENPWTAITLLCSLVSAGISVVTLSPSEMIFEQGSDMTALVLAVVEFGRSHSESASKSIRAAEVWTEKRRQVREEGGVLTRRLPAWVEERNGKLVLVPERARVVRHMFELCVRGYGLGLICKALTEDGVPNWGNGKIGWTKCYVHKILKGRAAIGEFQPTCQGKPDGDPIPDYYPSAVDENTWHQVQVALGRRKHSQGAYGEKVASLFQGLLVDAISGNKLVVTRQGKTNLRILKSLKNMNGSSPCLSFPAAIFEQALLSMLREIDPRQVLNESTPNQSELVAAKLASKEQQIRQLDALMDEEGADSPTLGRRVLKLDQECAQLKKELAILRQQESNPLSLAWAESRSLWDIAATDQDHRLKLRETLRAIIASIMVLIVPRQARRIAAVQVYFTGSEAHRDYLVLYRAAAGVRQNSWVARSMKHAFPDKKMVDLRNQAHVCGLKKMLESVDLDVLSEAMDESKI